MGLRSVQHMLSLLLLPPQGEDSSCSSPAPASGPSHGRQFSINCPNVGPPHELQLFSNYPSVGPFHGVQSFRNRLLQRGSPMGSQLPSGIHLLWRGVPSNGLQVDICSTMDFHGLQVESLPLHGLHNGLQGKTLHSSIWSTYSSSSFTDLGVCRVVSLTSSHSSLSTAVSQQFFSSPSEICYHGGAATVADWLGLVQR